MKSFPDVNCILTGVAIKPLPFLRPIAGGRMHDVIPNGKYRLGITLAGAMGLKMAFFFYRKANEGGYYKISGYQSQIIETRNTLSNKRL